MHSSTNGPSSTATATTLTGADAAARAGGKNLHDQEVTHDFHGFTTGSVPDTSTHKFSQITVVEHEDVIDRLALTKNGQLQYRMLPVHVDAYEPFAELAKYLDGNASLHGKPITQGAVQQVLRGVIRQLQLDGWKMRADTEEATRPSPVISPEMAQLHGSIIELTNVVRSQATPAHVGKRPSQLTLGDIAKQFQTMSEADRLTALSAIGLPGPAAPPSSFTSPPRKIFALRLKHRASPTTPASC